MWNLWNKLNRTKKLDPDLMETELSRCLTTMDIALLGIGHMVGAGIYVLTGEVAKNVAGPGIVLSFLLAGKTSLLAALCYAEFGARVPKAGSAYVYTYVTIGEFWAFVVGWNIVLEHMIGSASVARAWSGYLTSLLGMANNGTIPGHLEPESFFIGERPDVVALGLCLALGCLLAFGVKGSTYFNSVFTVLNMAVVSFVICFGLYFADSANWNAGNKGPDGTPGGFLPFGLAGVVAGAATCFYAFVGFDSIATSGEEAQNPARSIPIATSVAMGVVTLAYVGVSSALTLMVPYWSIDTHSALPAAFEAVGASWAKYLVATGALCGMTTTLFGGLFALPRCVYAMANDGLFFSLFGKVHPYTQTPVYNLIICSLLTGLIALLLDIDVLVEFMSIGTLMAYTIVSASVVILRYQPQHKYSSSPIQAREEEEEGSVKDEDLQTAHTGATQALAQITADTTSDPVDATNDADLTADMMWDGTGKLKPGWSFLETFLDFEAGSVVTVSVFFMTISMGGFWGVIHLATEYVRKATWWAVLLMLITMGCSVLCFVVVCLHQQSKQQINFKVPWVPFVPALSIFLNVALMSHLRWLTWLRLAVWLAIGLLIYFAYGIRYSKEGCRDAVEDAKGLACYDQMYSPLTVTHEARKSAWGTMHETIRCPSKLSRRKSEDEDDDKRPIIEDDSVHDQ